MEESCSASLQELTPHRCGLVVVVARYVCMTSYVSIMITLCSFSPSTARLYDGFSPAEGSGGDEAAQPPRAALGMGEAELQQQGVSAGVLLQMIPEERGRSFAAQRGWGCQRCGGRPSRE